MNRSVLKSSTTTRARALDAYEKLVELIACREIKLAVCFDDRDTARGDVCA